MPGDKIYTQHDIDESKLVQGLLKDVGYIKSDLNDIKDMLRESRTTCNVKSGGLDKRIKKLEKTEERMKIYVAVAIAIGGAIFAIGNWLFDLYMKLKS